MCFETFKEIRKKQDFIDNLYWLAISIKFEEHERREIERIYRDGGDDSYERSEARAQAERAEWLYKELIRRYKEMDAERIKYKKMAQRKMK